MQSIVAVERRVPGESDSPAPEPLTRGKQSASDTGGLSLFWRLFLANGAVLALVVVLLAVTPIEITAPIVTLEQLLILLAGLVVMLVINLILLRRILAPLGRVTELMHSVDPDRPGRRIDDVGPGHPDAAKLAAAFNGMLDRLEAERRERPGRPCRPGARAAAGRQGAARRDRAEPNGGDAQGRAGGRQRGGRPGGRAPSHRR